MLIQAGLVGVVIVFAVAVVLLAVNHKKPSTSGPPAGEKRAISVAVQDKLIKDAAGKPKVVLSMFEDFLCPHCGNFEQKMGATVQQLIDTGAVQADYYMVALPTLDRSQTQYYSSRAGAAAYCVADADTSPGKDAFRRFHTALYAQQPGETSTSFPTNAQLIETARVAGVASQSLSDCINNGKYTAMVQGLVKATGISYTPTIRVNGDEFAFTDATTPQDLINKITQITGPVPGLAAPAAPAPSSAPAPAAP
ncbi:MAG: thioredoxin domain-containing protein [Mycobacteriaceae bacterium]|nr:thioredoxin domain-containing protein [Mycobacteriaceae bacterium]